jgi:hypothetical protein
VRFQPAYDVPVAVRAVTLAAHDIGWPTLAANDMEIDR